MIDSFSPSITLRTTLKGSAFLSSDHSSTVHIWDARTLTCLQELQLATPFLWLRFASSTSAVVGVQQSQSISMVDLQTGELEYLVGGDPHLPFTGFDVGMSLRQPYQSAFVEPNLLSAIVSDPTMDPSPAAGDLPDIASLAL